MNSKQKLLTFTAIGTVFATAIAAVALIGSKNLEQLRVDANNKYSITITSEDILRDDEYSDNNFQSFYVFAKTNSNYDFDSVGYPSAYGDISSSCGTNGHILTVNNSAQQNTYDQGTFFISFEVQNVAGDVECVLYGDFLLGTSGSARKTSITINVDKDATIDAEHDYPYYPVDIAVYEILEATLDSIVISYNC